MSFAKLPSVASWLRVRFAPHNFGSRPPLEDDTSRIRVFSCSPLSRPLAEGCIPGLHGEDDAVSVSTTNASSKKQQSNRRRSNRRNDRLPSELTGEVVASAAPFQMAGDPSPGPIGSTTDTHTHAHTTLTHTQIQEIVQACSPVFAHIMESKLNPLYDSIAQAREANVSLETQLADTKAMYVSLLSKLSGSQDDAMIMQLTRQRDKARRNVSMLRNRLMSYTSGSDLGISDESEESEESLENASSMSSSCVNCEQNLFCYGAMFKECRLIFEHP